MPFNTATHHICLATSFIQVTLELRLKLWIILDPAGRAAEHLLSLPLHCMRVAEPLQESTLSADHGF
jgi:hypothetical protein